MVEKLIILLGLLLSLPFVVMAQDDLNQSEFDKKVVDLKMEIRQARLDVHSKIAQISFEEIIKYGSENGFNVDEMQSIYNEFLDYEESRSSFETHIALNNYLVEVRKLTNSFKAEVILEMSGNGNLVLLGQEVQKAIEERNREIEDLKNLAWDTARVNHLEIFDIRVNRAQSVLNNLEEYGYDTSEALDTLDEIRNMRNEYEEALNSRDFSQILSIQSNILIKSQELANEVRDLQIEIPVGMKFQYALKMAQIVDGRLVLIIDELSELGLDTTTLKEIESEMSKLLDEIEDNIESKKYTLALENFEKLSVLYSDLVDEYLRLIGLDSINNPNLVEKINKLLKSAEAALDETEAITATV